MPIVQQGSINTTALVVPDLYVQIVPPQNLVLNGVPTNVTGIVGTASWGPVGQPVIVATMGDYARAYGPIVARKFDMGTQVGTAVQQGAANFRCVRASDGTDTAAQFQIPQTTFVFTALYTGATGNTLVASLGTGSKSNSWRLTVTLPGQPPEVFDNITGAGAAFWTALSAAVNNGTGPQRGPSQLVVTNPGGTVTAPVGFTWPFTAAGVQGTDGAGITAAALVGVDIAPRRGMYALRGQGCSIGLLADADDPTQYSTQAGFALSEGIYMVLTGPAGDTISNAVLIKGFAGVDTFACKLMFGDWVWWNDQVNGTIRLVSPEGFVAGRLANLSPEQSSLNKPLYGVVGTQKSGTPGSGQMTTLFRRRVGRADPGRHRRHRQPAARRQFLGRAWRPQRQQQRGHERRQLHPPDQLHSRHLGIRHGPIRRSGHHSDPVPPYPGDADELPAEHAEPGPARKHGWLASIQRHL